MFHHLLEKLANETSYVLVQKFEHTLTKPIPQIDLACVCFAQKESKQVSFIQGTQDFSPTIFIIYCKIFHSQVLIILNACLPVAKLTKECTYMGNY